MAEVASQWHGALPDATRFPPAFLAFLAENEISVENYSIADEALRFVRVNPRSEAAATSLEALREQLGQTVQPVAWLPGFFSMSGTVKIASSSLYTGSHIYGIDAASGAAVAALGAQAGESVLDLCCAPGAKLCMLAEAVGPTGSVTGVDVAEHRLAACRTLCIKYNLENVRLYLGDGCAFAEPQLELGGAVARTSAGTAAPVAAAEGTPAAPSEAQGAVPIGDPSAAVREEPTRSERMEPHAKLRKVARAALTAQAGGQAAPSHFYAGSLVRACTRAHSPAGAGAPAGYDRVIVDAECTHDGSIKHLSKFAQWGWETFEQRFLCKERLATLEQLQRALLRNGFARLRPGGVLVYSTCSFARRQNEDVVAWLLACEPRASCVPLGRLAEEAPCRVGGLEHTVRFEPCTSRTSALFIAKIQKSTLLGSGKTR